MKTQVFHGPTSWKPEFSYAFYFRIVFWGSELSDFVSDLCSGVPICDIWLQNCVLVFRFVIFGLRFVFWGSELSYLASELCSGSQIWHIWLQICVLGLRIDRFGFRFVFWGSELSDLASDLCSGAQICHISLQICVLGFRIVRFGFRFVFWGSDLSYLASELCSGRGIAYRLSLWFGALVAALPSDSDTDSAPWSRHCLTTLPCSLSRHAHRNYIRIHKCWITWPLHFTDQLVDDRHFGFHVKTRGWEFRGPAQR